MNLLTDTRIVEGWILWLPWVVAFAFLVLWIVWREKYWIEKRSKEGWHGIHTLEKSLREKAEAESRELKAALDAGTTDLKVGRELIKVLSNHCGQRGDNEGAVETLERIIRERDLAEAPKLGKPVRQDSLLTNPPTMKGTKTGNKAKKAVTKKSHKSVAKRKPGH